MIFITLGTQLPFDRLVMNMDRVADTLDETVFGQIGHSNYKPVNFEFVDFLSPVEFTEKFKNARVVVAHAGIGTILTGSKEAKPLVLMARRANLGEHRNDHQCATAKQLGGIQGVHLAENQDDLYHLLSAGELTAMQDIHSKNRARLIERLSGEISI